MAQIQDQAAQAETLDALLDLWERGAGQSPARRGLLLFGAAHPEAEPAELAALPIGARDGALLDLGDRLFGSRIACAAICAACGTAIEMEFASAAIRATAAELGQRVTAQVAGKQLAARLPTSVDLLAIEGEIAIEAAERRLLARCLEGEAALGAEAVEAVGAAMREADPQAEILLDIACPDCAAQAQVPFDVVGHVWARLDHWARAMLAAVDAIAARYGWSEAAVLALSPRRRQSYLDAIAGVGR